MLRIQWIILTFVILFITFLLTQTAICQEIKTYRIAVLDLQPIGVSQTEALALSEKLRSSFSQLIETGVSKDKYTLVERSQMDKIFDQFEIQNTGCTDIECAVKFGKILSAERIVVGSVSLVGTTYMIIARIVDVESANTLRSVDRQHRGQIDDVISLMPLVSRELLTGEHIAKSVTMPSSVIIKSAAPAAAASFYIGKIAFTSNWEKFNLSSSNWEIYVINADGTNQVRLANNLVSCLSLTWSPDGSKIAFTSKRDGNKEIYLMNADGSNQMRLTNSGDSSPSWSPDGSKIAFTSKRDGNNGIYVMNSDGSNQTRLTNNSYDESPSWSPDGSKIAFTSYRENSKLKIYVMNSDGSNQTRLTNNF